METEKDFLIKNFSIKAKKENNLTVLQRLAGAENGQKISPHEEIECDGHQLRFDQNKKLLRELQKISDPAEKKKVVQRHWEGLLNQH